MPNTSRITTAIGSIAAAVMLAGCDVTEAGDSSHVAESDAQHEELVGDAGVCDLVAAPSVYFMPVRRYDDFQLQVQVDAVWYEFEGKTYEATCLPDGRDGCRAWVAGWERAGTIRVGAEYCDTVVEVDVDVPIDDAGCHVVTQYLLQPMKTNGCLATGPNPGGPPPHPLPL